MDILLLQASPTGGLEVFIFPLLIFAVMYFFMIRPGQVKQKKVQNSLAKGQEVLLSSGIFGRITHVEDEAVIVLIDDKTKIKVVRNAVSQILTKDA